LPAGDISIYPGFYPGVKLGSKEASANRPAWLDGEPGGESVLQIQVASNLNDPATAADRCSTTIWCLGCCMGCSISRLRRFISCLGRSIISLRCSISSLGRSISSLWRYISCLGRYISCL